MSHNWSQAEKFAKPMIVNLQALDRGIAEWQQLMPAGAGTALDPVVAHAKQFIAFRTELIRLARDVSVTEARIFGDNDANRTNRSKLNEQIKVLAAQNNDQVSQLGDALRAFSQTKLLTVSALSIFGVLVGVLLAVLLVSVLINRPLGAVTRALLALAAGQADTAIPGVGRGDEIGAIAEALVIFKEHADAKSRLELQQANDRIEKTRRQEELDQLVGLFGKSMTGVFETITLVSSEMSEAAKYMPRVFVRHRCAGRPAAGRERANDDQCPNGRGGNPSALGFGRRDRPPSFHLRRHVGRCGSASRYGRREGRPFASGRRVDGIDLDDDLGHCRSDQPARAQCDNRGGEGRRCRQRLCRRRQ